VYNLLFINPKKVNQWTEATRIMMNLISSNNEIKDLVKDKDNRVQLFETLKSIVYRRDKMTIIQV